MRRLVAAAGTEEKVDRGRDTRYRVPPTDPCMRT